MKPTVAEEHVPELAAADQRRECETVGAGSPPLKPPVVTTGLPVAMMMGAALPEPPGATRYFAEP